MLGMAYLSEVFAIVTTFFSPSSSPVIGFVRFHHQYLRPLPWTSFDSLIPITSTFFLSQSCHLPNPYPSRVLKTLKIRHCLHSSKSFLQRPAGRSSSSFTKASLFGHDVLVSKYTSIHGTRAIDLPLKCSRTKEHSAPLQHRFPAPSPSLQIHWSLYGSTSSGKRKPNHSSCHTPSTISQATSTPLTKPLSTLPRFFPTITRFGRSESKTRMPAHPKSVAWLCFPAWSSAFSNNIHIVRVQNSLTKTSSPRQLSRTSKLILFPNCLSTRCSIHSLSTIAVPNSSPSRSLLQCISRAY